MEQIDFNESAIIIGNEMDKFKNSKACNFGFITADSDMYRIFCGGYTDNIAKGIIQGILLICAQTGLDEEFVHGIDRAVTQALNESKGAPLQ